MLSTRIRYHKPFSLYSILAIASKMEKASWLFSLTVSIQKCIIWTTYDSNNETLEKSVAVYVYINLAVAQVTLLNFTVELSLANEVVD